MQLEAIRSRVREALRSRVRSGGVAYGYRLERRTDRDGRTYSVAIVLDEEAAIVRRIFAEYAAGRRRSRTASTAMAFRRPRPGSGTGSWSGGCVRAMLRDPRYRGVYVHGRMKKVRTNGAAAIVKMPGRRSRDQSASRDATSLSCASPSNVAFYLRLAAWDS